MSTEEEILTNKNEQSIIDLIIKEDDFKKDSEKLYLDFISKLVLYSSGIVTTSITGFITLSDKGNISDLKNYFIFIVVCGFITIITGLLIILFNSKEKKVQSDIFRNSRKDFSAGFNKIKTLNTGITFDEEYAKWKNLISCFTYITITSFILSNASIIGLFLSFNF